MLSLSKHENKIDTISFDKLRMTSITLQEFFKQFHNQIPPLMKALFKKILFAFILFFGTLILLEIALGAAFLYKDRNIEPENVKDFPYLYFLFDNKKGDYNEHGFKTKRSL